MLAVADGEDGNDMALMVMGGDNYESIQCLCMCAKCQTLCRHSTGWPSSDFLYRGRKRGIQGRNLTKSTMRRRWQWNAGFDGCCDRGHAEMN